jgi:hypothetical protein
MHRLIADVECKEQQTARTQNPLHLSQGIGDLCSRDMDDRIKGNDAAPYAAFDVQRKHVALSEINARIQSPSLFHHFGGQIHPGDLHPSLVEVAGDVPWSTVQVADGSKSLNAGCESVEELPVERLVLQFPVDAGRVFRSDPIVADLNIVEHLVRHR